VRSLAVRTCRGTDQAPALSSVTARLKARGHEGFVVSAEMVPCIARDGVVITHATSALSSDVISGRCRYEYDAECTGLLFK